MCKKLILVSLAIICLFFIFGFEIGAAATEQSLVSFSSGALLVEKSSEYSAAWGHIWFPQAFLPLGFLQKAMGNPPRSHPTQRQPGKPRTGVWNWWLKTKKYFLYIICK